MRLEETIYGEVLSIERNERKITLRTNEGETKEVYIGPLGKSLKKGQKIAIRYEQRPGILAWLRRTLKREMFNSMTLYILKS